MVPADLDGKNLRPDLQDEPRTEICLPERVW
jgi:hypothetical protein